MFSGFRVLLLVAVVIAMAGCKSSLGKFEEATQVADSQVQVIAIKSRSENRLTSLRHQFPPVDGSDVAAVTSLRSLYQDTQANLDAYLSLLQDRIVSGADFSKEAVCEPFLKQRDVVANSGAAFLAAADMALGQPSIRVAGDLIQGILVGLARAGVEIYRAYDETERRDREALIQQIEKQRMLPFEKVSAGG